MDNIGTGKVVIGLSLKVIEELLQETQDNLIGDLNFNQQIYPIEGNQDVVLNAHVDFDFFPVLFRIEHLSTARRITCLTIRGHLKLSVSSPSVEGPELYNLPFSIKLEVGLVLKPRANKAPVIGLANQGLHEVTGPIPEEMINDMINNSPLNQFIQDFELDLIDPAISGIQNVLFINENKPNRADWSVDLQLLRAQNSNVVEAYGIMIDIPGGDPAFRNQRSFVPKRAEIIIQFTDSMVQAMVEEAKEELSNWFETVNGVDLKVKRLNLSVDNNQLYLDTKIKDNKYDVEVTMKGPVKFRHTPGGMAMGVDIGDVDVDVDLPWWGDFFAWFVDIFSFGTAGLNNYIHNELPNFAQLYAQRTIDNILPQLANALDVDSFTVQGTKAEIYPDLIALNDGAITVYIQVLIQTLKENLDRADYSSLRNKFVFFHLESGRRYLVQDLADFMHRRLIEVPGYHDVDSKFIRSNPDNTEGNNLLRRFSR